MRDLTEVERLLGEVEGCLLLGLALVRAGLVESNEVHREFRRALKGCGVDVR